MSFPVPNMLEQHTFTPQSLTEHFPPKWHSKNKEDLIALACPPDATHNPQIELTRWQALDLPTSTPFHQNHTLFEAREDLFDYKDNPQDTQSIEWYLNFAHSRLFVAYGGHLLAQDELQVLEHPILASLREALVKTKQEPLTVENDLPTPILIKGAQRRLSLDTTPHPDRPGRLAGLYGNRFAMAEFDVVLDATTLLTPPTLTNILAMEAPPISRGGFYKRHELEYILRTAWTGFSAARYASTQLHNIPQVTIHTGFWGCGAYGGSRELMALLQLLAASLAGIDKLVFHTFDFSGHQDFADALKIANELLDIQPPSFPLSDTFDKIERMNFKWGESDGT